MKIDLRVQEAMAQHCDNCEKLKDAYADILQDNIYMCQKSIEKSNILLNTVNNLDPSTVENINIEMTKLLERMTLNLNSFKEKRDKAKNEYKRSLERKSKPPSPKKKSKLSLNKSGTTQETDVDLTGSEVDDDIDSLVNRVERLINGGNLLEDGKKPVKVEEEKSVKVEEKTPVKVDKLNHVAVEEEKPVVVDITKVKEKIPPLVVDLTEADGKIKRIVVNITESKEQVQQNDEEKQEVAQVEEHAGEDNHEDDESSDDDGQAVPLNNFDVQVTTELKDDEDIKDELDSTLTNLIVEDTQKVEEKEKTEFETSSFDFDDEEDLSSKLEKKEAATGDSMHQAQKDNHELLEMLNKATDNQNYPDYVTTEQEGDEALRLLDEEEASLGSHSDSDDSTILRMEDSDSDDGWEAPGYPKNFASASESEAESQLDLENFKDISLKLKLQRVDDLDDAEIDRLCNLHNLNKRKCTWTLRPRKSKVKRARFLSTSSSSSSSSSSRASSSSSGSTTPDLPMDDIPEPFPSLANDEEWNPLADECWDKLGSDNSDTSFSSDSETDIEKEEVKEKPKTKEKIGDEDNNKNENEEKENDEPVEIKEKKRRNGEDDYLLKGRLWSSSESESEEAKPKLKLLSKLPDINLETTVISDSLSDSDDDVTFVKDLGIDDSGKGRRNIRPIMDESELNEMTQRAKNEEDERIQRLEEHSKTMESIQSQHEDFVLDFDVKSGEPLIVVDANLAKKMKPHQRTGLQFMWEACYESVEMLKTKPGTGCILGHCMGLGKTLQVITLIHTLFTYKVTNTKHVLVVCPLSIVSNWKNEFKMAFTEAKNRPNINLRFLIKQDLEEKSRVVMDWRREGGVIVMGYEAFQHLTRDKDSTKSSNKLLPNVRKKVLEALIEPGPDLIVCDEGHLLKNGDTLRTKSLMQVATKRRIVLTGTPLQNNLMEYYFMVQFVKPHLLGTFPEYKNRFANPIMNGQYDNSTPEDIKIMKKRTHVLTKLLKKTINRIETKVLESYLPEIEDYTIFIKLLPLQIALYRKYIELVKSHVLKATGFFQDFRITKYISLHPYTLHKYYAVFKNKGKRKKQKEVVTQEEDVDDNANNLRVEDGWYEDLYPSDVTTNINYSLKMKILMAIINEAVKNGEKILIFAHQLPELECVAYFLEKFGTFDYPHWRPNQDFYKMDGEVSPELRSRLCDDFNTNPRIKVLLVSHGVGGLGLNLTAASRVVLIASNHNPSHDTQSIYRAYRFGQTKKCYVYRLLSLGTMEEKIYRRCVIKLAVAGTVVDKFHFDRHYKVTDLTQMYECDFESQEERPIPLVPNDKLLATLLQSNEDIFSYHEHKALLENRPEEELNDEDKNLAWDEFKKEERKEEAAKQLANAPPPPPVPPPVIRAPIYFPVNSSYPFNRFGQFCGPRNNAPSIVINPLSANARGQLPRGLTPNHAQFRGNATTSNYNNMRPNLPNLPQTNPNMYRPPFNGYNQNVSRILPTQNNPFFKLLEQHNSRQLNNKTPINTLAKDVDNMNRWKSVIRTNPISRLQNISKEQPSAVVNLVDEAPSTGEFNYALNKIV